MTIAKVNNKNNGNSAFSFKYGLNKCWFGPSHLPSPELEILKGSLFHH